MHTRKRTSAIRLNLSNPKKRRKSVENLGVAVRVALRADNPRDLNVLAAIHSETSIG